jgi:cell division protein FtsQ
MPRRARSWNSYAAPPRRPEPVPRARLAAAAVLLPAALTAPLWGPRVLARTSWFPLQRVEVAGTRLLAPHEVLAASGIRQGQSLWSDPSGWEARLADHPVIAEAEVSRRLPGTLRVGVREKAPVGLVEAETLRPVTGRGEVLPADPARVPMDLPLIRVAVQAGGIAPRDRALLAEVERLGQLDAGLLARVSEVGWSGKDLLLTLSAPDARVLVPAGAGSDRLRRLRAALADVEGRLAARGEGAGPVRIDLRFQDQVVVRFPSRA